MWISREQFDALEKRIAELEAFKRDTVYYRYFDVYSPEDLKRAAEATKVYTATGWLSVSPFYGTKQSISVKDVVDKILAHIGMELNYVSGHPARVEMQKKAKAKA